MDKKTPRVASLGSEADDGDDAQRGKRSRGASELASSAANATPLGVKVSVFQDILNLLSEREAHVTDGLGWWEMVEHPKLKKYFKNDNLKSYVELLAEGQDEQRSKVGTASVFISHSHGYKFGAVAKLVQDHFKMIAADGDDVYVWFDLFAINNKNPPSETGLLTLIEDVIRSDTITRMVLVCLPWDQPVTLNRGWCLYEIFLAHKHQTKLEVAYSSCDSKKFLDKLTGGNYADNKAFIHLIESIDFDKAGCSNPSDKIRIDKVVEDSVEGGKQILEYNVKEALKTWMDTFLEDRVVHSRMEMWRLLLVQAAVQLKIKNANIDTVIKMCNNMLNNHDDPQNSKYDQLRGDTYDKLGESFLMKADEKMDDELIEKALEYHHKALEIRKKIGAEQEAAKAKINVSVDNGKRPFKGNGRAIADSESQIGTAYILHYKLCKDGEKKEDNLAKAMDFHQKALESGEIWNDHCIEPGNYSDLGEYYSKLGTDFFYKNDLQKAQEYMELDLSYIKASPMMGKQSRLMSAHNNLGYLLSHENNDIALLSKGISNLKKALELKKQIHGEKNSQLINSYFNLAKACEKNNDIDDAYHNYCCCLEICRTTGKDSYLQRAEEGKNRCEPLVRSMSK